MMRMLQILGGPGAAMTIALLLLTGTASAQTQAKVYNSNIGHTYDMAATQEKDQQIIVSAEIWRLSDNYDLDIGTQLRYTGREGNSIDFISSVFPAADLSNGLNIVTDLLSTSYGFLQAEINLAQRDGNAELLTNPQITVIDGQPATLTASDRVPFRTVQANKPLIHTEYFNFGVTMTVTPTIIRDVTWTNNQFVKLDIDIEVSEVMAMREEAANQVQIPIASVSRAQTQVVVKSGTAFLMGGLYREQEADREQGVPFLKDIPGIGQVFKSDRTMTERSQVIFSVRPKILNADELETGITPEVIDLTQDL